VRAGHPVTEILDDSPLTTPVIQKDSTPWNPKDDDDIKIVEAYAQWQQDMGRVYGLAEVIVAKQRHGSTGKVNLKFEAKITRFSDLAEEGFYAERR